VYICFVVFCVFCKDQIGHLCMVLSSWDNTHPPYGLKFRVYSVDNIFGLQFFTCKTSERILDNNHCLLWCRGYQWSEASCWGAGKFAPSLGIGAPCEYHPLQPGCWFWISTPTQASSKQTEIDRPKGDSYPFTGCSAGIGSIYVYILLLAS
jgi:hypothetical protein